MLRVVLAQDVHEGWTQPVLIEPLVVLTRAPYVKHPDAAVRGRGGRMDDQPLGRIVMKGDVGHYLVGRLDADRGRVLNADRYSALPLEACGSLPRPPAAPQAPSETRR